MTQPRNLLWVDCIAGGLVAVLMLLLQGHLVQWYGLARPVVLFVAFANLVYALYSFSLAVRKKRSLGQIRFLVVANLSWPVVCVVLVIVFAKTATILGIGHLLAEALFVGTLGMAEWRARDVLVQA